MRLRFLLLFLIVGPLGKATTLPRVLSLDIGAGVPVVANGEIGVLFAKHWQIGFGYGYVPGLSALTSISLPDQKVSLDGLPDAFTVTPKLSATLDMLTPFLRYYPTDRNYYFQFSYSMLRMNMSISGNIRDTLTGSAVAGVISGTVGVVQPVPTIAMGHIFASQEFFVNLSLGVSFLLSPSVSVALSGIIPDALGGTAANQAAITQLQGTLQTQIGKSIDTARQQLTLIPSLLVSAGFFL